MFIRLNRRSRRTFDCVNDRLVFGE